MSRLKALVALTLAVAAVPTSAHAAKFNIGSSLVGDANVSESAPRDWSAYPSAQADGSPFTVDVQGEVAYAQIKGTVVEPAPGYPKPDVIFHFTVVRPQPDGQETFVVASDALPFPYGGDPNQVTGYDLQSMPSHICVQPGDKVTFATTGGFGNHTPEYGSYPDDSYADGAQFRFFSRTPGSSVNWFEEPPYVGDSFQDSPHIYTTHPNEELLMRLTIGTGPDARYFCRTDAEKKQGYPNPGETTTLKTPATAPIDVPEPSHAPYVKLGKVPIRIYCRRIEGCQGTLALTRGDVTVGTAPFTLKRKETGHLIVPLNKGWRKFLPRKGSKATLNAVATLSDGVSASRTMRVLRKK